MWPSPGSASPHVTRGTDRSPLDLTIDAAMEAIADAGLSRADIDGVATWPAGGSESQGFAPVGSPMLQDALRLNVNWYLGTGETSGQLGAVFNAIGAIAAGVATHVLVFRTVYEGQARKVRPFANAMARSDGPGRRGALVVRPLLVAGRRHPAGAVLPALHARDRRRPTSKWPRSPSTAGATPSSIRRPSTAPR